MSETEQLRVEAAEARLALEEAQKTIEALRRERAEAATVRETLEAERMGSAFLKAGMELGIDGSLAYALLKNRDDLPANTEPEAIHEALKRAAKEKPMLRTENQRPRKVGDTGAPVRSERAGGSFGSWIRRGAGR